MMDSVFSEFDYRQGWEATPREKATPLEAKTPYRDNGTEILSADRYHDGKVMDREWNKLWPNLWLLAGVASDIPEPGDCFRFEHGRESFIIVRDNGGEVRAHYNVCPHRAARVLTEEFSSVGEFACPYHSWRFGLDGTNVAVRDRETFRPEVLCNHIDLTSVRCEVAAGLIFISMKPDIMPVQEWLGPQLDNLLSYDLDKMNVIQHRRVVMPCNWKVSTDAFYEVYHFASVHPQVANIWDDYKIQFDLYDRGMSRMIVPFARPSPRYGDQETVNPGLKAMLAGAGIDPQSFDGNAQDVREAVQQAKRERAKRLGLDYSKLSDAQMTDDWALGIFPNVQVGCHPEGAFIHRSSPHPTDPDQVVYDTILLYRYVDDPTYTVPVYMGLSAETDVTGAVRPDVQFFPLGAPASLGSVLDQDLAVLPLVQAGTKSRAFKGALWSEQEQRLRHIHTEYDRYMNAPDE